MEDKLIYNRQKWLILKISKARILKTALNMKLKEKHTNGKKQDLERNNAMKKMGDFGKTQVAGDAWFPSEPYKKDKSEEETKRRQSQEVQNWGGL